MSMNTLAVLVTGCAGFIGSYVVDALMADGHCLLGLDNLSTGNRANLRHWEADPRFSFIKADVTHDLERILGDAAARLGPIERVVHLAAQTMVPVSVADPVLDVRVNVEGTVAVLEYARRHHVKKVVFASSSAVYDDDAPVPVSEA